MSDNNHPTETKHRQLKATVAMLVAVLAVAGTVTALGPVESAAGATATPNASDKAPYYNNSSDVSDPDPGWWNGGNVTLDGVLDMFTRIPSYLIGTGQMDESGTGYVGTLLTGLIMAGAALVAVMGTGVGPIGGTIVAITVGYGLTDVGFAPPWLRPVLLFGIGITAAVAIRRAMN